MPNCRDYNKYVGCNQGFVRMYDEYRARAGYTSDDAVAHALAGVWSKEASEIRRYLKSKKAINADFLYYTADLFGLNVREIVEYFSVAGYNVICGSGYEADLAWALIEKRIK